MLRSSRMTGATGKVRSIPNDGVLVRAIALQDLERLGSLRGERRGREMDYLNERMLRILSA